MTKNQEELLNKALQQFLMGDFKGFSKTAEEAKTQVREDIKNLKPTCFEAELVPGRIVILTDGAVEYYGVILTSGTIIYFNAKGEIKGYLNNITPDSPYQVKKILVPTGQYFRISDHDKMHIAWSRPINCTVKKSISEIEKELGLRPGTLEICNE